MKAGLKQFLFNVVFTLILSLVVAFINSFYTDFTFINSITSDDIWIVFVLLLLGSFIKTNWAQFVFYGFMFFLFLIETLHSIYYGHPILPAEVYKFFTDFTEITQGIGIDTMRRFVAPTIIISLLVVALVIFIKKQKDSFLKIPFSWVLPIIAVAVLCYNASLEQGINRSQRLDQNLLRTALETTGSFLGKYLPTKLNNENLGGKISPVPSRIKASEANIILVFGESLTYKHMSLYGYHKRTTPKLDSLFARNELHIKKCIPAGTCTDISILSFLNQLDTVGQYDQLQQGNHFLFNLAKQNKYETYFISSQALNSTSSYIGQMNKQLIDHFSAASLYNPSLKSTDFALDSTLLPQLKHAMQGNQKKFIVMQMYGSHEEYKERYPRNFTHFKAGEYQFPQTAHYDNSILYTDDNLAKMFNYIKNNSTKPTYVFYVSDHGECVGEDDAFGHNMFRIPVLSVPLLYQTYNNPNDTVCDEISKTSGHYSHNSLSRQIGRLLGYDYKIKNNSVAYVNGLDIGGLDGFAKVQYNDSIILTIDLVK